MTLTIRAAKRENVWLLLGLAGGTGSGKTYSAMRLAKGLSGGERFAVVDTENGRASHYADAFAFDVVDLDAPFRPERYQEAIDTCVKAGHKVVVVDSMSHEWDGDGGMLDWQEEEFQRMGARDAVKMSSWIKPKMSHRKFVTRLLQVPAHVILCFRAAEKVEMVKDDKGKTQVVPKRSLVGLGGWVPIAEKNLPFELTLSALLTPDAPGLPKPIKLQAQHKSMVPLDQPLSEDTGAALAEWAHGTPETTEDPEAAQMADWLTGQILERSSQIDATRKAIDKHRAANALPIHVDWLSAQLEKAQTRGAA